MEQIPKYLCLTFYYTLAKELHFSLSFFVMHNLLFILILSTFMLTAGKQMNSTDPTTAKIKNTHPMSAAWSPRVWVLWNFAQQFCPLHRIQREANIHQACECHDLVS